MYRPYIESGRWLTPEDSGQRMIVISADTANMNGIKAGDTLSVQIGRSKETWQIAGTYRWLAGGNFTVEPVYAPLETVQAITGQHDYATFAMITAGVSTLNEEADYLKALKQRFQEHNIALDVYTTTAKLEQRQFSRNQFNSVVGTLSGLAALITAVGGMGLSGTLAIGVLQRTREIGVLRAIGAPSPKILQLFMLEGFWHGALGWLLSIPLACLAAPPVAGKLGEILFGIRLDFVFDYRAIVYWLAAMLCLAGLAAYWPAKTAARMTVRDALDHA
jgi:putative ABC transport system permease protein